MRVTWVMQREPVEEEAISPEKPRLQTDRRRIEPFNALDLVNEGRARYRVHVILSLPLTLSLSLIWSLVGPNDEEREKIKEGKTLLSCLSESFTRNKRSEWTKGGKKNIKKIKVEKLQCRFWRWVCRELADQNPWQRISGPEPDHNGSGVHKMWLGANTTLV